MSRLHNAIINNVYNYYQSSLTPRQTREFRGERSDRAGRRNDLKDIYSSIRNIDKESPTFILDFNKDIRDYTVHMKESALRFRSEVSDLGGLDNDKMFSQKSVLSSDPSIADAKQLKDGATLSEGEQITLEVERLARPQRNEGSYIYSDDIGVSEGSYSFDVSTGGINYELQFSVSEDDTNLSIQKRLSRLINNSGIGISAAVKEDGYGRSSLQLTSNTTGLNDGSQPFLISDDETSQQGGIVDFLGIRDVTQEAAWASYKIDGESLSSPTNEIVARNTFSVSLKREAPGTEVTLETKPDYESLSENIKGLASSYNSFIQAASEYLVKQPRTTLLIGSMKQMTRSYGSAMEKLGISQTDDGTLSIDEEKLSEGLTSEDAGDSMDSLKNFTSAALNRISKVQLNPMDYVDKRIVAYKNPLKEHFANPYMTSMYTGMMFNGYM